jgi:hypothetical protein
MFFILKLNFEYILKKYKGPQIPEKQAFYFKETIKINMVIGKFELMTSRVQNQSADIVLQYFVIIFM